MKTLLQKTLGSRLHGVWFMLVCLLLVSLLTDAILLANEVSWALDGASERINQPIPTVRTRGPSLHLTPQHPTNSVYLLS